jgi:hypothetical protein
MDYKRIYDDLMQSRLLLKEDRIKLRKMGEYFEAHHILPKSMGGLGDVRKPKDANIVLLTGREHYIAHALLFLIYRNREMAAAFRLMCTANKKKDYKSSARMYEFLRVELKLLGVSDKTREKMRQISLGRKFSPEARERMRQGQLGKKRSPEGIKKRTETRKRNRLLKLEQLNGDIDWSRWEEKK